MLKAVRRRAVVVAPLGGRRVSPGALWQRGALAAILIVALLPCHGVMGFAHQISVFPSHAPAGVSMIAEAHHGPTPDAAGAGAHRDVPPAHDAPGGPPNAEYFAALLALSGTVLLALLFVALRGRGAAAIRRAVYRSPRPEAFAPRARGPSPPLLQAFRL